MAEYKSVKDLLSFVGNKNSTISGLPSVTVCKHATDTEIDGYSRTVRLKVLSSVSSRFRCRLSFIVVTRKRSYLKEFARSFLRLYMLLFSSIGQPKANIRSVRRINKSSIMQPVVDPVVHTHASVFWRAVVLNTNYLIIQLVGPD